jgi:uncharacterized protein YndB with AHSA1/START domain
MSETDATETTLRLERFIPSSPEDLFALWIEPEQLARWWAPEGYEAVVDHLDLRVGGCWRIVLRGAGGQKIAAGGVFQIVEPPRRLAFSLAWDESPATQGNVTRVMASFEPVPGGTRLVLEHQNFASQAVRDRHLAGWSASLDRIAKLSLGPQP